MILGHDQRPLPYDPRVRAILGFLLLRCELEWASDQSWHSALSAGSMRRQPLSDTDLQDVYDMLLRLRLPNTIASDILDFAEFWRCSSVARSEYVMMPMGSTKEKPYLSIKVPDRPLRALTIITESHNQGEYSCQIEAVLACVCSHLLP